MDQIAYNANSKIFLFDTETEGLNLCRSRPWQIAGVELIGLKRTNFQASYIWWEDLKVSKEAAAITRFDYNKYKSFAQSPVEVWGQYKKYFLDPSYILAFHNGLCFDLFVLKTWLTQIGEWFGFELLKDRCLDTRALTSAYRNNVKPNKENFESWQYQQVNDYRKGVKTSLASIAKDLDIPYDPSRAHDAEYDIEINAEVLKGLCYKMNI